MAVIFVDSNVPMYLVGARAIAHQQHALSARDCLHVAVMERRSVAVALTCDTRFALRPGIECVP